MENPFSLKFGQVFTGFGVGCGFGIGIGRPIYFGAIPALQPVLSATRGATDVFSGVGRHFNSSLGKLGVKGIEAGIGCGVGIGHGFGVGVTLKPWILHGVQTYLTETVINIMTKMGVAPSLSSGGNFIPDSTQSGALQSNLQAFRGVPLDVSKTMPSTFRHSKNDGTVPSEITSNTFEQKDTFTSTPTESRAEKVLNKFLQSPLKKESEAELDEAAQNLRSENNVLHVVR